MTELRTWMPATRRLGWLGLCCCASLNLAANAQIHFTVTLEGVEGATNPTTGDLAAALRANAIAGFEEWTRWLAPSGPREIEVVLRVDSNVPRGGGSSVTSAFVENRGGIDVFEEGVAHEIRTGEDPNGSEPDAVVTMNPAYLRDELWFDPAPGERTASIPAGRLDALGFFAHEFGHVLGFNGWGNTATGGYPGNYRSRFDRLARWDGTNWYFDGVTAAALYGGPVPLSRLANTYHHYGNPVGSAAPGQAGFLIRGLMNGVVFEYQRRYAVGLLDLAFARDLALPVATAVSFVPPALSLAIHADGLPTLRWTPTPLAHHAVEATDEIEGPWEEVSSGPFAPFPDGDVGYSDTRSSGPQRFFRLKSRLE